MLSARKMPTAKRHKASNGLVVRPSIDALVEFVDKEYEAACIIRKAWKLSFKFDLTRHRINLFLKLDLSQQSAGAMRCVLCFVLYG
jgi:hypothetical protein